jgi:hypothetical protein
LNTLLSDHAVDIELGSHLMGDVVEHEDLPFLVSLDY